MRRREIRDLGDRALVERLSESLSARGPLAGIPAQVIAGVVGAAAMLELAAGEMLIREGDPATPEIYLLIDGALVVRSKAGLIARLDQPGAVVGEVAVVLSSKRTADVVADSAVHALAIPTPVLALAEFADVAAGIRGAMLRDDWIQY